MKPLLLVISILFLTFSGYSQIRTPPLSQKQSITQKVGFTDVSIEYCRPLMRGRKIFGELEKYGEVWRTGANRNTQITFSEAVNIGGTDLEAATYTLFTRPDRTEWKVYFYPYDNEYGVPPDFADEKASASITVPVFELNRDIENLTINLENVTENTADLSLMWERTYIAIPITFTTDTKILADIDKIVNSHSGDYYMSARYYYDTDRDLEQAKKYIAKAIELRNQPGGKPAFWLQQLQAEILLKNKENKAALQSAEKALEMAIPRGEDDFYVKQIKELIEKITAN